MKLFELSAFLFPYRTHLERELEYAKTLLAQQTKRADDLQYELVSLKRPAVLMPRPVGKPVEVVPKGWDATRAAERMKRESREDKPQELPAGLDAGSADEVGVTGNEADRALVS